MYSVAVLSLFSLVQGAVRELNVGNFKDTILGLKEKEETMFVKFYAPWCGHCKNLAPIWEELSDVYEGSKTSIAHIDLSQEENRVIKDFFGVRGFPTLKLFTDGKVFDYNGNRNVKALTNFIDDQRYLKAKDPKEVTEATFIVTTTTTTTVAVVKDIIELTDANFEHETQASTGATTGSWLVLFYTTWCGHCKRLHPEWQKLANMVSEEISTDLNIAHLNAELAYDITTRFSIKSYPTIMLFKNGTLFEYKGARSAEQFLKWYNDGTYETAVSRPVPEPLTFVSRLVKNLSDMYNEIFKIYGKFFSLDTVKIMYHNQPILTLAGGLLFGMTGVLILYQFWLITLGSLYQGMSSDSAPKKASKKAQKKKQ